MDSTMPQQNSDPGLDPSALIALGKTAANLAETSGLSLTEAVVRTVGDQKLSAQQVRRVVERCNIEAVNRKHASLSGHNRIATIDGGPADPATVLKCLSVSSAKTASSTYDYGHAPTYSTKTSNLLFVPKVDLADLTEKLGAAQEELTGRVEASEFLMEQALEELKVACERAARGGANLAEVSAAWYEVGPAPLAKLATRLLTPVLPAGTKVAGRKIDPQHPVVTKFTAFAKIAEQHHLEVAARRETELQLSRVQQYLRGVV